MNRRLNSLATALLVLTCPSLFGAEAASPTAKATLILACDEHNDLYTSLVAGGATPARFDSAQEAILAAAPQSAVLVLADGYPEVRTPFDGEVYDAAIRKHLNLYVEYPAAIPGIELAEPRGVRWERAVVAQDEPRLGLPALHILAMHDCQFLPTKCEKPLLVMARVAGFDRAVFGLPAESHPILFQSEDGTWIATTKLSNFVTARYAPAANWVTLWQHLLAELDPGGAPHRLVAPPLVEPAFAKEDRLPSNSEQLALARCADWYKQSRLLIAPTREAEIHELLRTNQEVTSPPSADAPAGDGSHGILEGYASQILPDGSQLQRTPIRADCQAETAAVLALHAMLENDPDSERVARNLMNYLYFDSELHRRERGDPKHPAYGLIAWGAVSPAWRTANYGDDNARALLATMAVAGSLKSDEWDEPMLRALYANLRTTGRLGFRGDRIDMPQLEANGWKFYEQGEVVNLSPSFEAYSWACFLWAYARTGDREFLDKTKIGIRRTMEAYPGGWRWGDNLDRSRMVLALAWLVRVEDTPEHRGWLKQVAGDLVKNQSRAERFPKS